MTSVSSKPPPWGSPLWGCLLIGGKSSRMGRPKHLLPLADGSLWLERAAALVRPRVTGLALAGAGAIPASLAALPHLADAPGAQGPAEGLAQGPLAGIVAAFRFRPQASWLILACDMPLLSEAALDWLLAAYKPGDWAVMPRLAEGARPEPLFAWYGRECRPLLEKRLAQGAMRLHDLADHPHIRSPLVPPSLADAWRNVNTPAELAAVNRSQATAEERR
jgi:molybdopterin-guanine dinucleotide biosynthesis protein A